MADLFDVVIARKLSGGGGGGGGSSDFTTAEVTVTGDIEMDDIFAGMWINYPPNPYDTGPSSYLANAGIAENGKLKPLLYRGAGKILFIGGLKNGATYVGTITGVTGNLSVITSEGFDNGGIDVTGDGTVTVTWSQA